MKAISTQLSAVSFEKNNGKRSGKRLWHFLLIFSEFNCFVFWLIVDG